MSVAVKLLQNQLRELQQDPVEGFCCELPDDSNFFEWKIYIEGPRDTVFAGGVFQLSMKFPEDYPMMPPDLRFVSEFWHPNVYPKDGKVCISILHPPGDDPMSGELASERWRPAQTVTTILLSVISMLNAPNFSSPANVDASVEWRKDFASYTRRISGLVAKANREKPPHVKIPHPETDPEERKARLAKLKQKEEPVAWDPESYPSDDGYSDDDVEDFDDDGDNNDDDGDNNDDDDDANK